MKRTVLGISVLALFLSMGCATVMKGGSQDIIIDSSPQGAQVFVDGGIMGKTPLTLNLKKNTYDNIMVKKEGYKTQNVPLEKSFDGVAVLNIFWDLSRTDLIAGSIYEYEPNKYFFELEEGKSNRLYNNGLLDRDSLPDLRAYVLRKYYRIKQAPDTDEYRGFIYLLVRAYGISEVVASETADSLLIETDNPVDLISKLEEEL